MRVAVVGGGISGISAAFNATLKGHQIFLFEASNSLGGKAKSIYDSVSGEFIDNGQHALMGAYSSFLEICRALGTTKYIYEPQKLSIAFASPYSSIQTLEQKIFPGKYGTLIGLLFFKKLDYASKNAIIKLFAKLMFSSPEANIGCYEYLKSEKQTDNAIKVFWEPLVLAVLNSQIKDAPASLLINVIKRAFLGSSFESKLLLPNTHISKLFEPLPQFLDENGGCLKLSESVNSISKDSNFFQISTNKANYEFDKVIISLPFRRLQNLLLIKSTLLDSIVNISSKIDYSPIISIYLWYDKYVELPEMAALIDTKTQWLFNRNKFLQEMTSKYPLSLTCTISAATEIEKLTNSEIALLADMELKECFSTLGNTNLQYSKVIRERNATPLFNTENCSLRLGNKTDIDGLLISGDWTDTGLPATIESAALSGKLAADLL